MKMSSGGESRRAILGFIKFISIDVIAMDWLALVVRACGASIGSFEFFRTHKKGNQVLMF